MTAPDTVTDPELHEVAWDLTDLFEYAKFSSHPVDDLMKERAISALRSVREDLDEPAVAA